MSKYCKLFIIILVVVALLVFAPTLFWRSPDYYTDYGNIELAAPLLTSQPRDEHFARVIIDLVRKGERVFAIAGSSRAVKLEPALQAMFPTE